MSKYLLFKMGTHQFANLCALPNVIYSIASNYKGYVSPIYALCLSYFNAYLSIELAYVTRAVIGLSVFVNCFNEKQLTNIAVAIYQNKKKMFDPPYCSHYKATL